MFSSWTVVGSANEQTKTDQTKTDQIKHKKIFNSVLNDLVLSIDTKRKFDVVLDQYKNSLVWSYEEDGCYYMYFKVVEWRKLKGSTSKPADRFIELYTNFDVYDGQCECSLWQCECSEVDDDEDREDEVVENHDEDHEEYSEAETLSCCSEVEVRFNNNNINSDIKAIWEKIVEKRQEKRKYELGLMGARVFLFGFGVGLALLIAG